MKIVGVSIWVKPDKVEEFLGVTLENARGARTEPGNLRFDVLRSEDDPQRFFLYEVYKDTAAWEEHRTTPHYLKWKSAAEEFMARPRESVKYQPLFPEGKGAYETRGQ